MIPIMTFLCYADSDKIVARNFANVLEENNFKVFVAHDDIPIGADWDETLKNEIYNRELFLVLLSENFKNASFTNHEVGIATAYNKRIFSVIIDNSTPYGFMAKFQGKNIDPLLIPDELSQLVNELMLFSNAGKKVIDDLIEKLLGSTSWPEANKIACELFEYTTFTPDQINNIASAYVQNFEVNGSWTAGPKSIELLSRNWNIVEHQFKKKLSDMISVK